ncbi:hypothetical protein XELAEV_180262271mg, partial [Xenopus laevis]
LQLQHETIHEAATYGSVRPYRESPLLARARRTESFHGYRDFQSFSFGKNNTEKASQENGSVLVTCEAKPADHEICTPDKKTPPRASKALENMSDTCKGQESLDAKKRVGEDGTESKSELKRRSGFEGAFLARRKVSHVPHLGSSPNTSEGGNDSPRSASPSPTKSTTSPRRKKSDSSCQDYA